MKNSHPDILLIRKYLRGELSAREMHMLEKRAQEDPMLMDMMIGMESGNEEMHASNLSAIDQLIKQRVANKQTRKMKAWRTWMAAAASAVFVVAMSMWIFRSSKNNVPSHQERLATPVVKSDTNGAIVEVSPKQSDSSRLIAALPADKPRPIKMLPAKPKMLSRSTIKERSSSPEPLSRQHAETTISADSFSLIAGTDDAKQKSPDRRVPTVSSMESLHRIAGRTESLSTKSVFTRTVENSVKGVVKDKETDEPLPGASVLLAGKATGVHADSNGRFNIAGVSDSIHLAVSRIGYNRRQVNLKAKDTGLIALEPTNTSLEEVAVVGYNAKSNHSLKPVIGWKAYYKYLHIKAGDGNGGKVTVIFQVDTKGKPMNIRVIKGLNEKANQRAVELIYDGSRWEGEGVGSNEKVKVNVYFK
jgi:hypothetical protein